MIFIVIYIFTKSYTIINLWYQNLKFDNTYLRKGYLILVIPGIVSIDHVQYQNPQLYSTEIIEVVKGGKMSFSHSHHNLQRCLVCHDCHHNTDLRAG